jgi:hypothetical protein
MFSESAATDAASNADRSVVFGSPAEMIVPSGFTTTQKGTWVKPKNA